MGLLYTIIAGLISGFIAGKIMPGDEPGGIWGLLGFGVAGAFVGNFIFGMLGLSMNGIIWSLVSSVIGACLVIFIWKKFIAPRI